MASRDTSLLRPELLAVWNDISAEFKAQYPNLPQPFIDCTYRPIEEQNELYAQGRTTQGPIVTHAKGGQSAHGTTPLASAFDIAFDLPNEPLDWDENLFVTFNKLVQAKYSSTVDWGGYWPEPVTDNPHFECADWKNYQQSQSV